MSTIIADGNVMSSITTAQQQQTTIGCFVITDFCVRGLGVGGGGGGGLEVGKRGKDFLGGWVMFMA